MSQPDDQLGPQLRNILERFKTVPSRDPEAAARGRVKFLAYAQSFSANRRLTLWINPFSRHASPAMLATALLILILLLGGTGATVYAAQDSLPDTPLYPVKILSEDARTALALQPEAKLDLLLGYADRRVDEIAALHLKGVPPPESVTNRLHQQLDEALELGAEMPDPGLTQALERVEATIQRQRQTLTRVQAQVAEPAKPVLAEVQGMLEQRLRLVETGLADPHTLRQQMRGSGKSVTPPGQERHSTITAPEQERRSTITAPEQERCPTVTAPGQERRFATLPPGQERRFTITPLAQERRPTPTPTPTAQGHCP